jgi:hypothetical protein
MRGGNIMKSFTIKANADALVLNNNYEVIADKKFTKAITLENKQFITARKCKCCDKVVFYFNYNKSKIQVDCKHIAIN